MFNFKNTSTIFCQKLLCFLELHDDFFNVQCATMRVELSGGTINKQSERISSSATLLSHGLPRRLCLAFEVLSRKLLGHRVRDCNVDARHAGSRLYGRDRTRMQRTDLRPKRGVKLERKKNCWIKTKSYGAVARPVPKRVESATWTRSILFPFASCLFRFNFTLAPIFGLFASPGGHRRRFITSHREKGSDKSPKIHSLRRRSHCTVIIYFPSLRRKSRRLLDHRLTVRPL